MINYFKHTDGEAFTLNGNDYVGFFNIHNNLALTGKLSSNESLTLSPKSNFITNIFLNSGEFDTVYTNIPSITPHYSNSFDLLDANGMREYTTSIDSNNITCFRSQILGNPTIFKFEETNGKYYGLSSINEDSPITIPNKYDYRGNIEPFSISKYWAFLDKIISGVLVVNSEETFKYVCSDGENDYIITGNFLDEIPITISYVKKNIEYDISNPNHNNPNYTFSIHHDYENNKLIFLKLNYIEIYDSSTLYNCDNLILIDRISLKNPSVLKYNIWNVFDDSPNITTSKWNDSFRLFKNEDTNSIKFGKNLRTIIHNNFLILSNKYSTDVYQNIDLGKYDIHEVLAINIRSIDDYMCIFHRDLDSQLKISFFNPIEIDSSFSTSNIYNVLNVENYTVSFSDIDSNVFYITNTHEHQSRYISYPDYPSGRLEVCDLLYPNKLIWNTSKDSYNRVTLKWNSGNIKSNVYNNLLISETFANNKMYMILHNIGRLYLLNQYPNDRFFNTIPLDLSKSFNSISCSQTSISMTINMEISKLMNDTMNLIGSTSSTYTMNAQGPLLSEFELPDYNYYNLYFHGNETMNTILLQRISTTLTNLQYQLLPK